MIKQCFNPRSLGGYSRCSLRSAACREIDAFVEFLARGQYDAKQVVREWRIIIGVVVSALGACGQRLIISAFTLLDKVFDTDVFADHIAIAAQHQERE